MDMKKQIVGWVLQTDEIQKQISEHWTMVQKSVAAGDADKAITLLNAYFRLKTKAESVEAQLRGMLGGYFADK
jgi:hypothetical protein